MEEDSIALAEGKPHQSSDNLELGKVSMCLLLVGLKVILPHKYVAFPRLLDPTAFSSLIRVSRVLAPLPSDQLSIYETSETSSNLASRHFASPQNNKLIVSPFSMD